MAWSRRFAYAGGLASFGAGIAAACLPGLPTTLCGNGYIDANESCDPGPNINPGCNSVCEVVCPTYLDPESYHCYFPGGPRAAWFQGNDDAGGATSLCASQQAHVVTFVDDDELDHVVDGMPGWPTRGLVWVGLAQQSTTAYASAAANEPGWDVPTNCPGCFLHGTTSTPPSFDAGPEAGTPYGLVDSDPSSSNGNGTVGSIGLNGLANVVCEREPVGARSAPCNGDGSFCFGVLATQASNPSGSKRYLYNPNAMSSQEAATYCAELTDGGASSLVVLESRAEREQIIYEIGQLSSLPIGAVPIPTQFWIGLRTIDVERRRDGGIADAAVDGAARTEEWVWEDGVLAPSKADEPSGRPLVWGNHQPPKAVPVRTYAYINLSGGYDNGLAYAHVDDVTSDVAYPFVCQLQ